MMSKTASPSVEEQHQNETPTGSRAARGAVWASVDRFGMIGLQFVVNIVLARLLLPTDYGIIGMLTIFIAVSQTLIDGGFASALIQKKHPTQTDYSTIFFWNLGFSIVLYGVLYLGSPLVARFYRMPLLTDVLRVMGLTVIISSVLALQRTRLRKLLEFRTIAVVNLGSFIVGAAVAIAIALRGAGVWSLVAMQLVAGAVGVVAIAILSRWTPSLCFSLASLRQLLRFGGFLFAADILQTICQNLQGLLIGKHYSSTQMGYFWQAYKFDQITSYSIPQVIIQVMYPVLSSMQDDRERLNATTLMGMRVTSFIVFPILTVLILTAAPLITMLFSDQWLPSVPYFRILCVGGFFVSLQNINYYAVAAVGRSKVLFYWSLYKWGFLAAALVAGMEISMDALMWAMVASSANICIVNAAMASRHTGLKLRTQLAAVAPTALVAVAAFAVAESAVGAGLNVWLGAALLVLLYLGAARFVLSRSLADVLQIIRLIVHKQ